MLLAGPPSPPICCVYICVCMCVCVKRVIGKFKGAERLLDNQSNKQIKNCAHTVVFTVQYHTM